MRQLVIDQIIEAANDGFDLTNMEFNAPTTVADLPALSDEALLAIYQELVGFSG
jgi:hypothetical protein